MISMAWHVAAFMRSKRLPDHNALMRRLRHVATTSQTDEGMASVLRAAFPDKDGS